MKGDAKRMAVETERLTLLPLTRDHLRLAVTDLVALEGALNIRLAPMAIDHHAQRAIRMKLTKMDSVETRLHPWYTYWLIIVRDEETGVGLIGYKGEPCIQGKYDHIGEVELGYGVALAHRRRGYTTEAAQGLIAWAFEDPDCDSVIAAEVLKTNIPSRRVLEKLGMRIYHETEETQFWRIDNPTQATSPVCDAETVSTPSSAAASTTTAATTSSTT